MWNAFARRCACLTGLLIMTAGPAFAHGVVGDRFFPATLVTDDPFTTDELALPTITTFDHQTVYDMEYAKSIFPGFAISIDGGYSNAKGASGWDNISLTPAFELWRSDEHEAILTAAFIWDIGGTGAKAVADRSSTYTPEILWGKGFGDLPDSMALLRPFAMTGTLGFQMPSKPGEPNAVEWGAALEYSLLYLQNNVRNQGFSYFVSRLTPMVEFSLASSTGAGATETTGTIDPGLVWSGQYIQLGAEAMIPVNRASGRTVGAIAQLHFYVDDIFAKSIGRPIFGSAPW
jgi:hypothetical protein